MVATQNGLLYVYDVDEAEGGECKLVVKHDLRVNMAETTTAQVDTGKDIIESEVHRPRIIKIVPKPSYEDDWVL